MPNLRDRLKRIQDQKKNEPVQITNNDNHDVSTLLEQGWIPCGFKVLKRDIDVPSPFKPIKSLPVSLSVFVPDLAGRELPAIKDFLFFDLETTGLSGGAGTVAFLAAFGRVVSGNKLRITQYLLLDYPGENDFLEKVLCELNKEKSVIVSYNGKCFDSQIIKTRCLMNRVKPPEYWHVDLLHPSRRLWKNIIQDCSQASIETRIIGLDRTGDIPGALAPEIWFEFLRTGKTERLTGICNHNNADISGLSSILAAIIFIAANPFDTEKYRFDLERISLYWRQYLRRFDESLPDNKLQITGEKLLRFAAEKDHPRAVYVYGYDQMRKGHYKDALKFVNRGLQLFLPDTPCYEKLTRRKLRLEAVTQKVAGTHIP
jgi:hypothetical protein